MYTVSTAVFLKHYHLARVRVVVGTGGGLYIISNEDKKDFGFTFYIFFGFKSIIHFLYIDVSFRQEIINASR
jgi:hypothetical protein